MRPISSIEKESFLDVIQLYFQWDEGENALFERGRVAEHSFQL